MSGRLPDGLPNHALFANYHVAEEEPAAEPAAASKKAAKARGPAGEGAKMDVVGDHAVSRSSEKVGAFDVDGRACSLTFRRIRHMISCDDEVSAISRDAVNLLGKANDFFLRALTLEAVAVAEREGAPVVTLDHTLRCIHESKGLDLSWLELDFPLPPR